jgi:hypothetical protein
VSSSGFVTVRPPALILAAAAASAVAAFAPSAFAQTAPTTCFGQPATAGMTGTPGSDTINGTDGDDVIIGLNGNDTVDGKGGNDTICGGTGDGQPADQLDDDRLKGGSGNDRVNGGFGNDVIDGEGGEDTLVGDIEEPTGLLSTTDRINGGDGEDRITGGGDQDILRGEGGFDTIEAKEVAGEPARAIIDVVIGGPDGAACSTDPEDDVSECDARGASAEDRGGSSGGGGGGGGSSSGGSSPPDQSAAGGFFFRTLGFLSRRCLPQPPLVGKRGISAFRLGERTVQSLLRPLVPPLSSRRGRFVYCNEGGGQTYLLSSRGRVRLLATTAETKRTRGVAPGDRLSVLRRAYDDAERIGSGLYRGGGSSPVFFGVRAGKISFVAVSPTGLLADPADLARAVRQLGPGR